MIKLNSKNNIGFNEVILNRHTDETNQIDIFLGCNDSVLKSRISVIFLKNDDVCEILEQAINAIKNKSFGDPEIFKQNVLDKGYYIYEGKQNVNK